MASLNEEQLKKVSGGKLNDNDVYVVGRLLEDSEIPGMIGQEIIHHDRTIGVVYGTLKSTFEVSETCGGSTTMMLIDVNPKCYHHYKMQDGYAKAPVQEGDNYLVDRYK